MYGKGNGQILLGGFFVKKGGYAKIPPDGAGSTPQYGQFLFWQIRVFFAENHYFYAFLVHFQAFLVDS